MNSGMNAGAGSATGSETDELVATARSVFADHPAEVSDGLPAPLWSTLTELGLVQLSLPEEAGGSGGTLADLAALLLVAGEAAAPVPLAETELAGWLLHSAGLAVPSGVLAVAWDSGLSGTGAALDVRAESDGGYAVSGQLTRVGWARAAARLAVLATGPDGADVVLSVDPAAAGVSLTEGTNLAGEPRDDVRLDLRIAEADCAAAPDGTRELLVRRAALARALLLAGAAGRALAGSVRYAGERVQFGRPIAKFQAIQQQLALAAAEVAAGRAAAEAAARIAAAGDVAGPDAGFAIAVAKARTSEAAGVIARIAHQVHGAIGFTLEHDLRLATTRLWAWREEDGSDAHWHAVIARRVLAEGADGLWPLLTRAS
ncbi:MAG: acyl-CoA dehydrogenase [Pseudonocardiales bacterium]|jgi:acyl-CoA dehydrogenase|nr:acyl-CoA dehydrogenase [Pseudonocardiales bacterium]